MNLRLRLEAELTTEVGASSCDAIADALEAAAANLRHSVLYSQAGEIDVPMGRLAYQIEKTPR